MSSLVVLPFQIEGLPKGHSTTEKSADRFYREFERMMVGSVKGIADARRRAQTHGSRWITFGRTEPQTEGR